MADVGEDTGGGASQQRQDYRLRLAATIRYKVAKRFGYAFKESAWFKGIGVDFSAGGASFKIGRSIPKGYFMYIEIFFPFDKFPVSTVAEVIRLKSDTLKGKKVFLCIVRYLIISPTVQDKMVGYFINEGARREKAMAKGNIAKE